MYTLPIVTTCNLLIEKAYAVRRLNNKQKIDTYVNVKEKICVKLYNELCLGTEFTRIDEGVMKVLDFKKQVIENGAWRHVAMQKGDIEIKFNDTDLSKKISESPYMQKNGLIIKGEDCFIERVSPGGKDGEHYALIASTQKDLEEILKGLVALV
ncbi:MAG: hypothetical protein NTY80_01980 [candidate division SR1 bacterium]|nr:hypothetical protein [candidate division SR1 bacterium]